MVLAIDIGNTNVVLGAYENDKLVFSTRLSTDTRLESDQYALQIKGILNLHNLNKNTITGAVLSSVVPQVTHIIENAIKTVCNVNTLMLTHKLKTGIKIKIDSPTEMGLDLVASVIGAKAKNMLPAIIIDMGTATKITAADENGNILGCSIMPGVFISINALTKNASALGGIALKEPKSKLTIGTNTVHSMQSGFIYGSACMLDGMVDKFLQEMNLNANIIATGGASTLIVPHCRHKINIMPNIILDGLYQAYKLNN